MQISDITQSKKKPISEVNWGAIGGALAGIAGQAITGKTPQAASGQEAKVAQQLLQPLQPKQLEAAMAAWASIVASKMAQMKVDSPSKLSSFALTSMLTDYINTRLFAGRDAVNNLPKRNKAALQADIRGIVSGTKTEDNNLVAHHLESLVQNVQAATVSQVYNPSRSPQLTPASQVMMQRMAPQIAQLQQQWPAGQNQQVAPTNNQAVNALLAGLGLLRTSAGPVAGGAPPAQTPPPTGTK
jgi:restriction endonuclease Mrr